MKMNRNEMEALYAFGCPNLKATVERLRMVAALAPDPVAKKLFYMLSVKLSAEGVERWYRCFYRRLRVLKNRREGCYDETDEETIVLFNEGEDKANIYTHNAGLKKRLAAFAKKYPDLCRLEKSNVQGGVSYVLAKSRLSIRFLPPYSEERRQKASEYAKKHGLNSQQGYCDNQG